MMFAAKPRTKFIGNQNENKKVKRSRRIGPSHNLQCADPHQQPFGGWGIIVGISKTARTPHILLVSELASGIRQYSRAHQGVKHCRRMSPTFFKRKRYLRIKAGSVRPLRLFPTGAMIFNVPFRADLYSMLARAAGTFCKLL